MRAALLLTVACRDGRETDKPAPTDDTTVPITETGETTPVPTGDTALPPDTVWPICDHVSQTERVTLLGADRLDALGRSIDVADIDSDGCAEVAIAAPWEGYYEPGEGAVYLLTSAGLESGIIDERAAAIWREPGVPDWITHVALVPPQVAWLTNWDDIVDGEHNKLSVLIFDLPTAAIADPIDASQRVGELSPPPEYFYVGFANDIENCSGMEQPSLCAGSIHRGPEYDFAGAIWIYNLPVQGNYSILDFRTRIAGSGGERAEVVEAGDLDGDGFDDLAISAYLAEEGAGRIGLVSAPAAGDFLLWDVAYATLDGEIAYAEAGLGLAIGDLNGDGYGDVLIGAPLPPGEAGRAYVMTGPFSGSHPLGEASITVEGDFDNQWTGYDGAIGDMTGDGAAELIVGAPYSIYFNTIPGTVALFDNPTPGTYHISDANWQLVSGSEAPDAFGYAIAPGDIDGDGRMDLAIGAPDDPRNGDQAGSVTLVFGASL